MKTRTLVLGIATLGVIGAATLGTGLAFAHDNGQERPHGRHLRAGHARYEEHRTRHLERAAEALDMTVDELKAKIEGGKTIKEIANERGVDLPERPRHRHPHRP